MDDYEELFDFHTIEETFKSYKGRRKGIVKALTHDLDKFRRQCDKCDVSGDQYLGLYAFPSGRWEIKLSADVPKDFPHSRLYKLPKEETDKDAWLARVAADSDTWLFSITFLLCHNYGWDTEWRELFFGMMNKLPTMYELVIGNDKKQEVATENVKKRVKDKSTVSYYEVQGMSSSRLVSTRKVLNSAKVTGDIGYKPIKDLKQEGKKAITKRELPMRSAVKTRSRALGIQTRAQTGKSPIKKTS